MGQIHNSETVNEAVLVVGSQTGNELPPKTYSNTVVPVMELNPKILAPINEVGQYEGSTSNSTVYTTPSKGKFYLTNVCLCSQSDATSTNTKTMVKVYMNGSQRIVFALHKRASSASLENGSTIFPGMGLLIDPNTDIKIQVGTVSGSQSFGCYIQGRWIQ